jgi:glycosyltransferase involved in cell wall biosynthesis
MMVTHSRRVIGLNWFADSRRSYNACMVSVIIPCFNAALWIRETLASVALQNCNDLEIIAVDDGSTDGTSEIIRSEFDFVHLERTTNRGPSAARNLGTRLASGQFIQYLDADDVLAEGKIQWQRKLLEKSGADIAYGDWQELTPNHGGFARGRIFSAGPLKDPELDFTAGGWRPTTVYLHRRRILEKIGGWNEGLPHGEDERLAQDCALHGANFIYAPGVMAYIRSTPGSLSRREPGAAYRYYRQNALAAEAHWARRGGITDARRLALTSRLGRIARSCCDRDRVTFEAVLDDLERLNPGYIPHGPLRLRIASTLMGYRRAELAARWFRQVKRISALG